MDGMVDVCMFHVQNFQQGGEQNWLVVRVNHKLTVKQIIMELFDFKDNAHLFEKLETGCHGDNMRSFFHNLHVN